MATTIAIALKDICAEIAAKEAALADLKKEEVNLRALARAEELEAEAATKAAEAAAIRASLAPVAESVDAPLQAAVAPKPKRTVTNQYDAHWEKMHDAPGSEGIPVEVRYKSHMLQAHYTGVPNQFRLADGTIVKSLNKLAMLLRNTLAEGGLIKHTAVDAWVNCCYYQVPSTSEWKEFNTIRTLRAKTGGGGGA